MYELTEDIIYEIMCHLDVSDIIYYLCLTNKNQPYKEKIFWNFN